MGAYKENLLLNACDLVKRYAQIWSKYNNSQNISFQELCLAHFDINNLLNTPNIKTLFIHAFASLSDPEKENIRNVLDTNILQIRKTIEGQDSEINYFGIFKDQYNQMGIENTEVNRKVKLAGGIFFECRKLLENSAYGKEIDDVPEFEVRLEKAEYEYRKLQQLQNSLISLQRNTMENNSEHCRSYLKEFYAFCKENILPLIHVANTSNHTKIMDSDFFSLELAGKVHSFLTANKLIDCEPLLFFKVINLKSSQILSIKPDYLYYAIINLFGKTLNDDVSTQWITEILKSQELERESYNSHYGRINSDHASSKLRKLRDTLASLFMSEFYEK